MDGRKEGRMDGRVTRGDNKLTLDNAFTPMESIKLQVEQSSITYL